MGTIPLLCLLCLMPCPHVSGWGCGAGEETTAEDAGGTSTCSAAMSLPDSKDLTTTTTAAKCVARRYIVRFTGFYEVSARRGFIAAALSAMNRRRSGCRSCCSRGAGYRVVDRENFMAAFPSDFDLIEVFIELPAAVYRDPPEAPIADRLLRHPLIKAVDQEHVISLRGRQLRSRPADDFAVVQGQGHVAWNVRRSTAFSTEVDCLR